MTKALRGPVYTIAAWALRLALVAYGILVVTIRYPEAIPEPTVAGFTPERAYWLLILLLTLAPFVYALVRSWRELFFPALVLAGYATFDVLVPPESVPDAIRTADLEGHFLLYTGGRLLLLAGLWAATYVFARVERPRRRRDWALVLGLLLVFAIPELVTFHSYLVWSHAPHLQTSIGFWMPQMCAALAVVLAALALRDPGWPRTPARQAKHSPVALVLVGSALAVVGAVAFTTLRTADLPGRPSPTWPGTEILLGYVLVGPAIEEWGYRGVLWQTCRRRFGVFGTLVLTSTLFGLSHLFMGPTCHMPEQIVMGFVFGAVRWKTGTLWAPILAHALGNLMIIGLR